MVIVLILMSVQPEHTTVKLMPIVLTRSVVSLVSARPVSGVSMELCASISTSACPVTDVQPDLNASTILDRTHVNVRLDTNRPYEIPALSALM